MSENKILSDLSRSVFDSNLEYADNSRPPRPATQANFHAVRRNNVWVDRTWHACIDLGYSYEQTLTEIIIVLHLQNEELRNEQLVNALNAPPPKVVKGNDGNDIAII